MKRLVWSSTYYELLCACKLHEFPFTKSEVEKRNVASCFLISSFYERRACTDEMPAATASFINCHLYFSFNIGLCSYFRRPRSDYFLIFLSSVFRVKDEQFVTRGFTHAAFFLRCDVASSRFRLP